MKVEVFSDVVCPWCFIGERRFTRALEESGRVGQVEVVFRPYQLDPDAPVDALPLARYLEERFGPQASAMRSRVSEAAAGEGIQIDWDSAQAVNTLTAHRLLRLALHEYGPAAQRALAEALFELHFVRGGDVGDRDELTRLARRCGMEPERVRSYLDSDEGLRELQAELSQARRMGVRAVPTFLFDGQYAVQGARPVEAFVQALADIEARTDDA